MNNITSYLFGEDGTEKAADVEKEHAQAFNTLKEQAAAIIYPNPSLRMSDDDLRRFTVACEWQPELALERIKGYVHWRTEPAYGGGPVDEISSDSFKDEQAAGTLELLPVSDLDGRPILLITARLHDAESRDIDRVTRFIVYMLDQAIDRLSEPITTVNIMINLAGMSLSNMDYQFVKRLIYLLDKFYPERMGVTLVIAAPQWFSLCWSIIKPWLAEKTMEKVQFVPSWKKLGKWVPIELLPDSMRTEFEESTLPEGTIPAPDSQRSWLSGTIDSLGALNPFSSEPVKKDASPAKRIVGPAGTANSFGLASLLPNSSSTSIGTFSRINDTGLYGDKDSQG